MLQIAHPAIAAGVAEHSDFRADPWRRLDGTLRSYLRIIYGTTDDARAEIRRLHGLHATIVGPGYSARDPDQSLWVHATLIDSTLVAYDRWRKPLRREQRARFYAETIPIGRAFGIPSSRLPADIDTFDRYVAEQLGPGGPVRPDPTARELARTILHPPLPGALGRLPIPTGSYDWTLWPAVGLLPPSVRAAYGLRWGTREALVSRWLVAGWRSWRPFIPADLREMPQARAADRRMGRETAGRTGSTVRPPSSMDADGQ